MEECSQSRPGTCLLTIASCCNDVCTRDWNDELTSKLPAKRPLLFMPSSEYGKRTSAAVCWSAFKMSDCFGRPGRRGKSVYGIRESSKVWLPTNPVHSALLTDTETFRCRAVSCPTLSEPCHVFNPSSLAQAACYATGRDRLCGAVCQCSITISHSLQVARAVARALEAFPPSQDRR
jgi:hypothetical protein